MHFVGILLLAMVEGSPSAIQDRPPPPPPILSFIVPDGAAHNWKLWRADTGATSTLITLKLRPANIFWRVPKKEVLYTSGSWIYRIKWSTMPASAERIAELPTGIGAVRSVWIDKRTGRIRVASMLPVAEEDIINSIAGIRYRLPDGQTLPALAVPNWGSPYVAYVRELGRNGWKPIARRSTKDDAGETPGLSVLDEFRDEDGISNERLLESYTCATGVCRNDVPTTLLTAANRMTGRNLDPDATSITPDSKSRPAIIFATSFGDTLHMTTPILGVSKRGAVHQLLDQDRDQIGIAICGTYVLVAGEGNGDDPAVFETSSGKKVFSSAGLEAAWIPSGTEHCKE